MDAETIITPHMPSRPGATSRHLPWASMSSVTHSFAIGHEPVSELVEIFKKTPFVSGLHSVSRDVVKDIAEIGSIPLLTMTTLDHHLPQVSGLAGRMIAESSTAVKSHSHQDVFRSADARAAACADVVGSTGNQAKSPDWAVPVGAGISNGKLTAGGGAGRTSERAGCATNHGSGTHRIFANRTFAKTNRIAIADALCLPAGVVEKQCYADH
ncbi:hypothetical protein RPMA_15870 [Tardiphaga alba]|uniref:Uncharacterized protein n=1 Tax=Tardiphaga alba TaxID=340268 RepID=A0ABX8ABY7_9BRAD|nr:hypothetical protein [Tardiphaga alba]QUS40144.1 hypothetical protein RPMA_15870 [Tardiphaga alba]